VKKRGGGDRRDVEVERFSNTEVAEDTEKMKNKGEEVCTGRELAKVCAKVWLSEDDAKAWRRDLKSARERQKAPVDKWRKKQ
jgi:hypothetical protein